MSTIHLDHHHLEAMVHHAKQAAPHEACGLLLGHGNTVDEVLPIENISQTPTIHYEIDPNIVAQNLDHIVGFYHSHPNGDAIPSQTDIRSAWPNTTYCIIGLKHAQPRIGAWMMNYGEVSSIEISSTDQHETSPTEKINQPQTTAIIISAILAFIIFITVSISLLPPAPIIPS